jgi:Flp pilus assembly protein CpaB
MRKVRLFAVTVVLALVLLAVEIMIVRSVSRYGPEISVVYARTKIPANAVVSQDMLEQKKIGISYAHRQSVRSIESVLNKKAKQDIEEGEMVLESKLVSPEEIENIKAKNPENRLIAVEFRGDQANGWWLAADRYVDIIFIPDGKTRSAPDSRAPEPVQRIRNIRIAAVMDDRGRILKGGEWTSIPKYISFEVAESQDEFLAYAKGNGRLELSIIPDAP